MIDLQKKKKNGKILKRKENMRNSPKGKLEKEN